MVPYRLSSAIGQTVMSKVTCDKATCRTRGLLPGRPLRRPSFSNYGRGLIRGIRLSSENTGLLVLPFCVSVFISEMCEGEEVGQEERERKKETRGQKMSRQPGGD